MKGILCFAVFALVAAASAQVGDYVATNGGYTIAMSIRAKGVWSFQSWYLGRPNKRGTGKWAKAGKGLRMVLYANGKPMKGPDAASTAILSPDGRTLTSRSGSRVFVFKKVVK